jgi:uncharacterized protein YbcV (DUF1398 family)
MLFLINLMNNVTEPFLMDQVIMFQLDDIIKAHAKVKSGADFPGFIRDLKKLGVKRYHTFVEDGHTDYFGENNFELSAEPKYSPLKVSDKSNEHLFSNYLRNHQQGKTDYPTFCRHSALTGVEKWTVDLETMTCTYYNRSKSKMLEESIPAL